MRRESIKLEYHFELGNGLRKTFTVSLQKPSLKLVSRRPTVLPEWTNLTYHQCPNCPLDPAKHPHCPVAANLVDVVDFFRNCLSTEEADVRILAESREYHKRAPVQHGISSLMGIYMVTSGCPVMDKLRPMVHTHLPFSSVQETMYRAVSMYLLAQYYRHQRGQVPDWKLEKLVHIYDQIGKVNQSFAKRLLSTKSQDASPNALVSLDCFATFTAFSIVRDSLKEMEYLFEAYLRETDGPPHPEPAPPSA
jgi:hypothetical protein